MKLDFLPCIDAVFEIDGFLDYRLELGHLGKFKELPSMSITLGPLPGQEVSQLYSSRDFWYEAMCFNIWLGESTTGRYYYM